MFDNCWKWVFCRDKHLIFSVLRGLFKFRRPNRGLKKKSNKKYANYRIFTIITDNVLLLSNVFLKFNLYGQYKREKYIIDR